MKTKLLLFFPCILFSFGFSSCMKSDGQNKEKNNSSFEKGDRAPADHFTGAVWMKPLVTMDTTFNCVMTNVTFEPKARTNWHRHPAGQILLVTEGSGYYQERGKALRYIHAGDVIKCPPQTIHWHGASHDQALVHIGVNPNAQNGVAEWLEPVPATLYDTIR